MNASEVLGARADVSSTKAVPDLLCLQNQIQGAFVSMWGHGRVVGIDASIGVLSGTFPSSDEGLQAMCKKCTSGIRPSTRRFASSAADRLVHTRKHQVFMPQYCPIYSPSVALERSRLFRVHKAYQEEQRSHSILSEGRIRVVGRCGR